MKKTKTRTIVRCALIASLYTAVSLVLAPIAFGAVQARVSEAFTLLPCLCRTPLWASRWAVSSRTLWACLPGQTCWARWTSYSVPPPRSLPRCVRAALPVCASGACPWPRLCRLCSSTPLSWAQSLRGAFGPRTFAGFLLQAGGVALGQLFSCFALGLPLVRIIEKTPALRAWFRD